MTPPHDHVPGVRAIDSVHLVGRSECWHDGGVAGPNQELSDFLRRARASVDPSRMGLPADVRPRRVPGLRREEVAFLAGVSTDYYTRLEQGRSINPSQAVVDAVARALELDAAGRAHLSNLVGAGNGRAPERLAIMRIPRAGLRQLVDALDSQPALILGRRSEVVASNRLAHALFTDFSQLRPRERNYTRWILLSSEARELFVDWAVQARVAVENLRLDVATYSDDPATWDLVEELREGSPEFRQWWEAHRVQQRTYGSKRMRHPLVGELTVDYETLTFPGDPEIRFFVFTTKAGSPSRRALEQLAGAVAANENTT
jgi:transcriptional regulator with XRE-family HTH domain